MRARQPDGGTVSAMHADDRLALARAVARAPRARIVSADNSASDQVPLTDALTSGRAYFVVPRAELMAIDVDLPSDPVRAADILASFDRLIDAAVKHGVSRLVLPSGRRGHSHGYFVVGTGPARTRLEHWCKSHGLDVRNQGIRPPGSPHRSGRGEAWTHGSSVPAALAALRATVVDKAVQSLTAELCPPIRDCPGFS